MPTTDNKNDLKPTPDSPAEALATPANEELPAWMTKSLDFLKKYQNVFYAIATVVLLSLIGLVVYYAVDALERITIPWHVSQQQDQANATLT